MISQTSVNTNNGFTLIEVILYVAIVTIVITALVQFAIVIVNNNTKSATQQEVYNNARFISEKIKYEIRNASGINSLSTSQIILATTDVNTNPTTVSLSGNNIFIKRAGFAPINLNSTYTTISNLSFINYSSSDLKTKNIQYTFTISAAFGNQARQEYQESLSIQSSAELRSN